MPSVSVVIPTYNRAALLSEALDSVFGQTYTDFEVIVVDDGSTDNTAAVVAERGNKDRYIRQENQGRARARNAGILAARGRYLALLDDDDRWLPDKLRLQVDLLRRQPEVDLVYGDFYIVRGAKRSLASCRGMPESGPALVHCLAGVSVIGAGASVVLLNLHRPATDYLFDAGYEPCEDWELWFRMARRGDVFAYVPTPLVDYRFHGQNTSPDRLMEAMIRTLHRFFDEPGLPAELREQREHHVNRLLMTYGAAYFAGEARTPGRLCAEAITAIKRDPTMRPAISRHLVEFGKCHYWDGERRSAVRAWLHAFIYDPRAFAWVVRWFLGSA